MKFLVDNQRAILPAYVNSWGLATCYFSDLIQSQLVLSLINLIFFSGTVILSM
ncbi:hypothetical protein ACJIZ3_016833 [Penstemon smallii]|uniref:Uncharacterized protein n=1 Tax=Penstemon smallii TaxID=265156 RepID=A0ABD3SUE6_9LAMI